MYSATNQEQDKHNDDHFEHSKETVMKFAAQERYKETSEEKKE